jgi:ankyrin repeat protein
MEVIQAIQGGDLEGLKRLLASDPRAADQRNEAGIPAVLFALYFRRRDMAEILLDAGAAVDLPVACALGLADQAASMLDMDPHLVSLRTADGWTALHLAAFFGQPEAARLLLDHGADPLARSENAMANLPLHAAAAARQAEIVKMLLVAGTPPDARQQGGNTAMHSAAQNGDLATLEVLRAHDGRMDTPNDAGKTPDDLLGA